MDDISPTSIDSPPPLDINNYRHHLETLQLTHEQETELLQILCSIMVSFVDLGWGLDPAQNILGAIAKKAWDEYENPLNQEDGLTETFNQTTEKT